MHTSSFTWKPAATALVSRGMFRPTRTLLSGVAATSSPSSSMMATSSSSSSARRQSFRPFSMEDEAQLVRVLTTRPRHVARHIRQSMLHSRKQAATFRNGATFLMIQLQSRLQRQELSPEDASSIVESVMKECVGFGQRDMAHLLFRAALRFRKFGLTISPNCVKYLFESYRGNEAKDLLLNLAEELKAELGKDSQLRAIVLSSFMLSGAIPRAEEVFQAVPKEELRTDEVIAMLEGYGASRRFHEVETLLDVHLLESATFPNVSVPAVCSVALTCLRGDPERMRAGLDRVTSQPTDIWRPLTDNAVGTIFRVFAYHCDSVAALYELEATLKQQLHVEHLGLPAETALIAKCCEFVARGQAASDEIMLAKVQHLRAVVESGIANAKRSEEEDGSGLSSSTSSSSIASLATSGVDDLDQQYLMSLIKGFGILGKLDDMKQAFELLRDNNALQDSRIYDEMLKWYAYANNVKEVVALKDEMTAKGIPHTSSTFQHVFRVLDRHYPRMVEKYYLEMKEMEIPLDHIMYPTMIRVFADLQELDKVKEIYKDVKERVASGHSQLMSPHLTVTLMRAFHDDAELSEQIIADATNYGHLQNDRVQAELLSFYSSQGRNDEAAKLVRSIVNKSPHVFRVLLRDAARRKDRPAFDALLEEMQQRNLVLNERLYSVIITAYSHFQDMDAAKGFMSRARQSEMIRHPQFFADAASAFARMNNHAMVQECWEQLLASGLTITMYAFNRFLDLFMSVNDLDTVQKILSLMMKSVPPNPITATTVVDMLGKMGRLTEMETLLDEMTQSKNAVPTLVTYHQAMNAYAKVGDIQKMEAMRLRVKQSGLQENHVTFNILAEGYGRAKRLEHLQELVAERKQKQIAMEEFGYVILLGIFGRARMAEEVRALVEELERDGNVPMTSRLLATVASAYGSVGDTPNVEKYVSMLLKLPSRRQSDVESLFVLYSRLRDTRRLQQLLETVPESKTQFVYNVCTSAFAKAGEHTKVATLLQEMERLGFHLSRNTSVTLSSVLLKAGKVQLAQAVLHMYHEKDSAASDGKQSQKQHAQSIVAAAAAVESTASITAMGDDEVEDDIPVELHVDDDHVRSSDELK